MRWLTRIRKRRSLKQRAFRRGARIVAGRFPDLWTKFETRQLIRINRICAGLPPFSWDGEPRMVRGSLECRTSLYKFGNVLRKSTFPEAVGDLVAFNNLNLGALPEREFR